MRTSTTPISRSKATEHGRLVVRTATASHCITVHATKAVTVTGGLAYAAIESILALGALEHIGTCHVVNAVADHVVVVGLLTRRHRPERYRYFAGSCWHR